MEASKDIPVIAITSGEPAGIGPELAAIVANGAWAAHIVIIGNRELIEKRGEISSKNLPNFSSEISAQPGASILDCPLSVPAHAGILDAANSPYVLTLLETAIDGALAQTFDAVVTGPVQKSVINEAGIPFTGHTEFFAERTNTANVVMMLAGGGLRVALATTHLSLANVPAAITCEGLTTTLRILNASLINLFGIAKPRIAVTGLNPHAGESGHLGREEIETIQPVISALTIEGMHLQGPFPADTLFTPDRLKHFDAVLAMYHDQGLAPLKYASFGEGINITLGLPIIRTSVDHGTALDLAGKKKANAGSMREATKLAIELANNRRLLRSALQL
jgi:4-hydroxythreonine-4-phosphate dehydrogenase